MIAYLETAIRNVDELPRPNREFFSLNHNHRGMGFNIMLRGTKVVRLIDWETTSHDALPHCVEDYVKHTNLNPQEWWAHIGRNGVNFNVLPYRLEADETEANLDCSTCGGAEWRPFPDWDLIENNSGPLGERTFLAIITLRISPPAMTKAS